MNTQLQKKWRVIYTKGKHEKTVAKQLSIKNISYYLPLNKTLRQWSDRKVWKEMPLFPNYIFLFVDASELLQLPFVKGYVRTVFLNGKIAEVSEKEIETIKLSLSNSSNVETSNESFKLEDEVIITEGPFIGQKGKLVNIKGKKKFAIKIEAVDTFLILELDPKLLERL